jgi:hypothetical protein
MPRFERLLIRLAAGLTMVVSVNGRAGEEAPSAGRSGPVNWFEAVSKFNVNASSNAPSSPMCCSGAALCTKPPVRRRSSAGSLPETRSMHPSVT